ncbi:MAG: hypothetical protein AAFV88_06260 [Planctomycetota bacterium]
MQEDRVQRIQPPCLNAAVLPNGHPNAQQRYEEEKACCLQSHADDPKTCAACLAGARYRYRLAGGDVPYEQLKDAQGNVIVPQFCGQGVTDYDCGVYCGEPYYCCEERESECRCAQCAQGNCDSPECSDCPCNDNPQPLDQRRAIPR